MPREKFQYVQTAFTAGELSPRLDARSDLESYYIGCRSLKNMIPTVQGEARSRPGCRFRSTLRGTTGTETSTVRLEGFSPSTADPYVLALRANQYEFYRVSAATRVAYSFGNASLFTAATVAEMSYYQRGDVAFFAHETFLPFEIARTAGLTFVKSDFTFFRAPQRKIHPDPDTVLTFSAATAGAGLTVTASGGSNNAVFEADSVGEVWFFQGRPFEITGFTNSASVTVELFEDLENTDPSRDFTEPAHGEAKGKGYYRTIVVHQGRLWLGGTTLFPFALWGSVIDDFTNFRPGTADDDAVAGDVTGTGIDAIIHLVSGASGLEIYTEGGEVLVPGGFDRTITPGTFAIQPQTTHGTRRNVAPVKLDAQSVFTDDGSGAIREFVFSDVQEAFNAVPLSIRSENLLVDPIDMTVVSGFLELEGQFLFVLNSDGQIVCMTSERSQQVAAWADWETQFNITAVLGIQEKLFAAMVADDGFTYLVEFIEDARFDIERVLDNGSTEFNILIPSTATVFSTTRPVGVFVDEEGSYQLPDDPDSFDPASEGHYLGTFFADGDGEISFSSTGARALEARYGLLFDYDVIPMLLTAQGGRSVGAQRRAVYVDLEYRQSAGLQVNGIAVPDRQFRDLIDNEAPDQQTGVKRVYLLGYKRHGDLVTITGSAPFGSAIQGLGIVMKVARV